MNYLDSADHTLSRSEITSELLRMYRNAYKALSMPYISGSERHEWVSQLISPEDFAEKLVRKTDPSESASAEEPDATDPPTRESQDGAS